MAVSRESSKELDVTDRAEQCKKGSTAKLTQNIIDFYFKWL